MWVARLERLTFLIYDNDRTRSLGELQYIVAHAYHK